MKDDMIHQKIEDYFLYGNTFSIQIEQNKEAVEEYKENVAKRLITMWNKCKNDPKYKVDFETSLRNYLLIMKRSLTVPDYVGSHLFEELGLSIDSDTGKIWVKNSGLSFSNDELVRRVFMQNYHFVCKKSKHELTTNSYIRKITGAKFNYYKSDEQKMVVSGALKTPEGYTCLVSMSTGGGKSLVTQSIAYQNDGLTIVVVPTISLMLDQTQNAKNIINTDADNTIFYYHSGCDLDSFIKAAHDKQARLLFVSPESLIKNEKLKDVIVQSNQCGYLKNLVVDEAHIVIEWGSAFRIDFQCLDVFYKSLKQTNPLLRTFLLSATYSDETVRQLKMFYGYDDKWIEIRCDRLRHEIVYDVCKCNSYAEKRNKVIEAIKLLPRPMIVYVKSPDDAEELQQCLVEIGYNNSYIFTGRTGSSEREKLITMWKNNEFDLMIATCAFGVGVDKKDVRTVLHTYIPENPNKYYQEAGRGGRDGLPCLSQVIYTKDDVEAAFSFVSKVITTEKLKGRWFSMLHSAKTQALLDNRYLIDTYVKPSYNEDEVYIDSISNQDINWNVYVILFMRRHRLLTIDEVNYINGKYIFYITILERKLLSNDSVTEELLSIVREREWKDTEHEFGLIQNSLNKVGRVCWSTMLNKVYRETDEYCSGCNAHIDINDYEDEKTIKKEIRFPEVAAKKEIAEYMFNAKWISVISPSIEKIIPELVDKGINVLVADEKTIKNIANRTDERNSELLLCNYNDWIELSDGKNYFVSGAVAVVIPEDIYVQKQIFRIVDKNIKCTSNVYIICSEKDYYLEFKGKNISSYVSGPCLRG